MAPSKKCPRRGTFYDSRKSAPKATAGWASTAPEATATKAATTTGAACAALGHGVGTRAHGIGLTTGVAATV